jgi:putative membrane protein
MKEANRVTTRNLPPLARPSLESAGDLAAARTLLAAERTLMAWIRTALSLFSFGFTIYKVLQGLEDASRLSVPGATPRNVGLFMAGMGAVAMLMGTLDHWHSLRMLRQEHEFRLGRPPMIMAILMSVTGLVLLFGILARLL